MANQSNRPDGSRGFRRRWEGTRTQVLAANDETHHGYCKSNPNSADRCVADCCRCAGSTRSGAGGTSGRSTGSIWVAGSQPPIHLVRRLAAPDPSGAQAAAANPFASEAEGPEPAAPQPTAPQPVASKPAASQPAAPVPPPMAPAVAAIMATKPATPGEKVRAAKILAGLDRPDLAKQMLAEVLAANLDQKQLFELEQTVRCSSFRQLVGTPGTGAGRESTCGRRIAGRSGRVPGFGSA